MIENVSSTSHKLETKGRMEKAATHGISFKRQGVGKRLIFRCL